MEQSENTNILSSSDKIETVETANIALEMEDVGNLETVLRSYYLSQIKSLETRKDRKQARELIEDHLVLPKSRQRTSKDSGYIQEVLGIEPLLLARLEDSRLIRRISKQGGNPIYEISHDTLVEPILAGKRDREAIALFLKKAWKYALVFLLLWFLFGMLFENCFQLLPTFFQSSESAEITLDKQNIDMRKDYSSFTLSLPPIPVGKYGPNDSIRIKLPLDPIQIVTNDSGLNAGMGLDTISIRLVNPIEVPMASKEGSETYQTFSAIVPLAVKNGDTGNPNTQTTYANVSGNLRVMNYDPNQQGASRGLNMRLPSQPIEMNLGDTTVQAEESAKMVPIALNLRLSDLFSNEDDKNKIRNTLGDREVKLNYNVQVRPTAVKPPPPQIQYPSVEGIEVKYSDGTSKFISNGGAPSGSGAAIISHTVAPRETLFSIAKKYGIVDEKGNTSTKEIKQLNGLQGNNISVGQSLKIPVR